MGAPLGNQNAKGGKGKVWAEGIRRAIRENVEGEDFEAKIAALARALVANAKLGDLQSLKEIGDRLDGKAAQTIDANVSGSLAGLLAGIGESPAEDPPLEA